MVNASELGQYKDKRVVLVVNPEGDGDAVELEGTAVSVNEVAVLLKPTGKTKYEMIEVERIEEIRLASNNNAALKRKVLKPVALGQARSHLLERHGYTLSDVNGLTEDEAFALHQDIDHEGDDLGHVHQDKSETDAAQAVAAAEA